MRLLFYKRGVITIFRSPALLLALYFLSPHAEKAWGAGDNVQLTFRYSMVVPTCHLEVTPETVVLEDINIQSLKGHSWTLFNPQKLTITLSNCTAGQAGWGRPVVTVTGDTLDSADKRIFRDKDSNGGTSQGVGILLQKKDQIGGSGSSKFVQKDEQLYIPKSDGGYIDQEPLSAGTIYKIPLTAGLGCADNCKTGNIQAGSVKASLKFNFVYK